MFKSLFTPLKARFEQSRLSTPTPPLPPLPSNLDLSSAAASTASFESFSTVTQDDVTGGIEEDFGRDAHIELMRQYVESVKGCQDVDERMKLLEEINRIMVDETATKDVFRELDGFLAMMSLLSALHPSSGETEDQDASTGVISETASELQSRMEVAKLVLAITSQAMLNHPHNRDYFETRLSFDVLTQAISPFTRDPRTMDTAFSYLLCLAVANFSLVNVFQSLRSHSSTTSDPNSETSPLEQYEPCLTSVLFPHAVLAMTSLLSNIPQNDKNLPYWVYKIIERLVGYSHRNQAGLNALGLGRVLFEKLYDSDSDNVGEEMYDGSKWNGTRKNGYMIDQPTEMIMQRLLKKMLGVGASTKDVRMMLRRVVNSEERHDSDQEVDEKSTGSGQVTVDSHVLEILRSSMRMKWPEHFAFEGSASIELREEGLNLKGIGCPHGFSFMAWISVESLPTIQPTLLFGIRITQKFLFKLSLRPDGKLEVWSNGAAKLPEPTVLEKSVIQTGRWTHVTLVHYPAGGTGRSSNADATIRLFLDGALTSTLPWALPKLDTPLSSSTSSNAIIYNLGDLSIGSSSSTSPSTPKSAKSPTSPASFSLASSMRWSLASAYLLSIPLADDIARLVHHLGPRYNGHFQDPGMTRFLTYSAATSLNIYIFSVVSGGMRIKTLRGPREGGTAAAVGVLNATNPNVSNGTGSGVVNSMPSPAGGLPAGGVGGTLPLGTNPTALMSAIKYGMGIPEDQFIFALSPPGWERRVVDDVSGRREDVVRNAVPGRGASSGGNARRDPKVNRDVGPVVSGEVANMRGDVLVYRPKCMDVGVWEVGGAGVLLRLVELANNPHDLCNAIGIFTDTLRTSWQNSEDIERIRGYEILAAILRSKNRLINMATFEVLFEFLGVDFRVPEASTIVNTIAYRFIALDFEIWSCARKEVQQAHLEHFVTLLQISRYKRFNVRQRLNKFGLVRRFLFVLQTNMYQHDVIPFLVEALKVAASQNFSVDEAIKPIVAYLAANLHDQPTPHDSSPTSVISRIDRDHAREKAEQVLECLTSLLSTPSKLDRFTSSLPLTRICLLLLGDHPSPVVASQILLIIALTLAQSTSFNRKFELVSGWTILKNVLPNAWDPSVHVAAFDVLMGRLGVPKTPALGKAKAGTVPVVCPYILPAIIASLDKGLSVIAKGGGLDNGHQIMALDSSMEVLVEELIDLHSSSLGFRELFKSHHTTALLVDACKGFAKSIAKNIIVRTKAVRLTEKLTHLVLMLALDNNVDAAHKQELLNIIRTVEESSGSNIDTSLLTANGGSHIRRRSQDLRRSLQMLGDRTYQKSVTRIHEWRKTIAKTERKRLKKQSQDLQEHHRQAERLNEWRTHLVMEPGLWSMSLERKWRLDETEGPYRIRKKLEPEQVKIISVKVNEETVRNIEEPEEDFNSSVVPLEVPPWAETYEISSMAGNDDSEWVEDIGEDKHRRVRHELEPGDVIEAVQTATRIVGVDSSPGLLILGRTHLYMLDGLVEGPDGEVIEAKDAPRNLFSVPGSMLELDGIQRAQRWPYDHIAAFSKRTYLFRDVALEIYFRDTRNLLVVFGSKQERQNIHNRLLQAQPPQQSLAESSVPTASVMRTPLFTKISARIFSGFREEIYTAQRKWQFREISNFTYLSIINQTSGRTPSDATQYPVYPWVLKDYSSATLDLTSGDSFRDLSKPMGALTSARADEASARYEGLEAIEENPFHYGTHFSSSMITCHFLMRLEPFAHMFKRLQGGDYDLPDRLFTEIRRAYKSASEDSRGDVRELIPEFFTCPEFLINASNIDFGTQNSGEKINDVKLPPWAKQDPFLFIVLHRRALESDYVSENLPKWIDLIWGCKQRDPESLNVFHPLSYEGSVDLDSISDETEREATVGIIHNFGQTPRKIFSSPHPPRLMHGITSLPLGTLHGIEEDHQLLTQSSKTVKDFGAPVATLTMDSFSDRVLPCRQNMLYVPSYPHEYMAWGFLDQSLRLYSDRKLIQCYEASFCTCAVFPDSETLITGSHDAKVRLWRLTRREQTSFSLSYILNGHREKVLCVVASRAWSLAVSGSQDGSAMIWELNRAQYVRSIEHGSPVHLAAINESTGYIATCSRDKLSLHTMNAHQIVSIDVGGGLPDQRITSLAFHEREYSYLGVLVTGTAGGSIILRTWNADDTPEGEKARWRFDTIRTLKCRPIDGFDSSVTALRFVGECLYSGQENGKVFTWDLPE